MTNTVLPRLRIETVGEVTVISFVEPALVKEETVREIAERLCIIAERPGSAKLILDFHAVQTMSSRMLAVLIGIARKIERGGGGVKLCGVTPPLLHLCQSSRLYRHFEIYREPSSALGAFARQNTCVCV